MPTKKSTEKKTTTKKLASAKAAPAKKAASTKKAAPAKAAAEKKAPAKKAAAAKASAEKPARAASEKKAPARTTAKASTTTTAAPKKAPVQKAAAEETAAEKAGTLIRFAADHPEVRALAARRGWTAAHLALENAKLVYTTDRWATLQMAEWRDANGSSGFPVANVGEDAEIEFAIHTEATLEDGGAESRVAFWLNNNGQNYMGRLRDYTH